jgi:hypothetical protein
MLDMLYINIHSHRHTHSHTHTFTKYHTLTHTYTYTSLAENLGHEDVVCAAIRALTAMLTRVENGTYLAQSGAIAQVCVCMCVCVCVCVCMCVCVCVCVPVWDTLVVCRGVVKCSETYPAHCGAIVQVCMTCSEMQYSLTFPHINHHPLPSFSLSHTHTHPGHRCPGGASRQQTRSRGLSGLFQQVCTAQRLVRAAVRAQGECVRVCVCVSVCEKGMSV